MQKKTEITIGGTWVSFLGIAFIVLKLTHQIEWSWWWVLAPFWIPWAIVLGIVILCAAFGAIFGIISR